MKSCNNGVIVSDRVAWLQRSAQLVQLFSLIEFVERYEKYLEIVHSPVHGRNARGKTCFVSSTHVAFNRPIQLTGSNSGSNVIAKVPLAHDSSFFSLFLFPSSLLLSVLNSISILVPLHSPTQSFFLLLATLRLSPSPLSLSFFLHTRRVVTLSRVKRGVYLSSRAGRNCKASFTLFSPVERSPLDTLLFLPFDSLLLLTPSIVYTHIFMYTYMLWKRTCAKAIPIHA